MTSRTDKPITCKPHEVRALLARRKTMHRVALKGRDAEFIDNLVANYLAGRWNARPMPYAVGDRLWVRETWAPHASGIDFAADIHPAQIKQAGPWRSPIHMPRWASRLTLTVMAVKVERLQDISAIDAELEGVECDMSVRTFVDHFRLLWERLHGPSSWEANPYVAAISFSVHRCNIDALGKEAA